MWDLIVSVPDHCLSFYLVFNPIMVNNFASLFNCTPAGRASDSMMDPT